MEIYVPGQAFQEDADTEIAAEIRPVALDVPYSSPAVAGSFQD